MFSFFLRQTVHAVVLKTLSYIQVCFTDNLLINPDSVRVFFYIVATIPCIARCSTQNRTNEYETWLPGHHPFFIP